MDRPLSDDWRDLNATQRDILVLLAIDDPRNGADINRQLGCGDAYSPTAYQNLKVLRERGLVTTEGFDDRAEKAHHLTDDGRELIRESVVETARLVETAGVVG